MDRRKNWTLEEVETLYATFRPASVTNLGKTVLLADPDENARALLAMQLERKGFIVCGVDNALDALLLIKQRTPDCCVLDMALAPVSGMDLLETISRDETYSSMIIYVSTSSFLREEHMLTQIYGAAGLLKKPVQPLSFIKEFTRHLTQT